MSSIPVGEGSEAYAIVGTDDFTVLGEVIGRWYDDNCFEYVGDRNLQKSVGSTT